MIEISFSSEKDEQERERFLQSEVFRFGREEEAEQLLTGALSTLSHEYLPSSEIRLRPRIASRKQWWPKTRFAEAHQMYMDALNAFDGMSRKTRRPEDLADLSRGLMVLVEAANALAVSGWDVNWRQNVQWALRGSRFGLSSYSLVERNENLPDHITLSERLEIIGGPIFYRQKRKAGKLGKFTPTVFAGETEVAYGSALLSRGTGGRRYVGDWTVDERGASYRLLSD
ncbi:hypothetical protein [Ensifer sp. ENS12]|uniref:hypothetical protein n=1 Tax=Ensifer sp. ENS12 TaxID=2854774 RepID=UPI001C4442CD|nr:hypothetical protein [Ensifer sp. ENS12]MBV7521147.1 hypothetical protein [Ensifer sp. ENS12]